VKQWSSGLQSLAFSLTHSLTFSLTHTSVPHSNIMSFLSHLEDSENVKRRNREANEYRVGVIGPASCGKSSIVAKLHRIKGSITAGGRGGDIASTTGSASASASSCESHLNKVMCVPVAQGQPLGIKIVPSKSHPTWCCVHSFLPADLSSQQSAVQADGRILSGDLLVAIGDTTLMNKSPFDIVSILKAADHDVDNHLLITFLRAGVDASSATVTTDLCKSNDDTQHDGECTSSCHSSDLDSSTSTTQQMKEVYIDHPTVTITSSFFCYSKKPSKPPTRLDLTSYHLLSPPSIHHPPVEITVPGTSFHGHDHLRPSLIEVIDLPGNDPQFKILREWIPRLDAILLVYSATSTSSLLTLEKKYLRLIAKLSVKEPFEIPLVVVCNKSGDDPLLEGMDDASSDDPSKLAEYRNKRDTLIMEGRAMAEAWNAPFFVTSCVGDEKLTPKEHVDVRNHQNCCIYDGFEHMFEAAIGQFLAREKETNYQGDYDGEISCTPAPTKNIQSILNFLPFLGECLTIAPEDISRHHTSSDTSARKLRQIEFSPTRVRNRLPGLSEGGDSSSVVSVSDDDDGYSSGSLTSVEDCYDNDIAAASNKRRPWEEIREKEQLSVKKKTGYTHDVLKLNFTGQGSTSLIKDPDEGNVTRLIGSQIVGME
jgi:GTPase SAR1 family protein